MKTVAIMNVKGGVGKTMTACNMSHILAELFGRSVLLVDCDPQANASDYFRCNAVEGGGLSDLLTVGGNCGEFIQSTDFTGLDIIPADSGLFSVDIDAVRHPEKDALSGIQDIVDAAAESGYYDAVILDLPPAFTAVSMSALSAADSVIVPVKMDAFSVQGMAFLLDQLAAVHRVSGDIHIDGILVTLWHNCDCNVQAEAKLRSMGIPVFDTHIRRSDKADESTWFRQPIQAYSRMSSTAQDYRAFVLEYINAGLLPKADR